jgi:hypothetical protein
MEEHVLNRLLKDINQMIIFLGTINENGNFTYA